MAAETGNTYISETMRDSIEIPTANLGFTSMSSSKKASASDCNNDWYGDMATKLGIISIIYLDVRQQIRYF